MRAASSVRAGGRSQKPDQEVYAHRQPPASATFRHVTVTEAAERLGLSPRTLQEQISRGRIKAVRHGPIWWITEAEVKRYRAESLGKPGRKAREKE
jgi:excisionase family DNA binding protein